MSARPVTALPADVLQVLDEFRTCEFTTVGKGGGPVTWPLVTYRRSDGVFLATTSIGLPQKAWNIRRNPRVAMLFSDPTGSGLTNAPTVLVQGDAVCPDQIVTDGAALETVAGFEEYVVRMYRRQPIARFYGADPVSRRVLAWYYYRLLIEVTPLTIRWWYGGQVAEPAGVVEVAP